MSKQDHREILYSQCVFSFVLCFFKCLWELSVSSLLWCSWYPPSSTRRPFAGSCRVRSWPLSVPAAVLCSGRCPWSPQGQWRQKPPPSTSCSPTAGWLNWQAACPAWHTSPIRPLVCPALPNRGGHDECPGFVYLLFWETIDQDLCRPGRISALKDHRRQPCCGYIAWKNLLSHWGVAL